MGDDYINSVKEDLVANLFNDAAREELWRVLARKNKFNLLINDFNLALEHPSLWNDFSMQRRSADFEWSWETLQNSRYWALGNFSIYALPEGTVIPLEGGGHRICVNNVYLYIHDTFNFEGPPFLGLWDFKNKKFPSLSSRTQILHNGVLNDFRNRHGYGKDFTVLSPLYKLPDFGGMCWNVK